MKKGWLPPLIITTSFDEINEPREVYDWDRALAQRLTPEEREERRAARQLRREERREMRREERRRRRLGLDS